MENLNQKEFRSIFLDDSLPFTPLLRTSLLGLFIFFDITYIIFGLFTIVDIIHDTLTKNWLIQDTIFDVVFIVCAPLLWFVWQFCIRWLRGSVLLTLTKEGLTKNKPHFLFEKTDIFIAWTDINTISTKLHNKNFKGLEVILKNTSRKPIALNAGILGMSAEELLAELNNYRNRS